MAQYLISVLHDESTLATPEEGQSIDVFNEALVANGHWVFAGGLGWPSAAVLVDNRGAAPVITDGPFVESKEFVAGFWIIEAADLGSAQELAIQGSKACNRKVELRAILTEADMLTE